MVNTQNMDIEIGSGITFQSAISMKPFKTLSIYLTFSLRDSIEIDKLSESFCSKFIEQFCETATMFIS